MANNLTTNPIKIDTAQTIGAQVQLASLIYVKSVRWSSATAAGHLLQIISFDGNELWTSIASGANYTEEALIEKFWPWFRVNLIQSGVLYITYS